MSVGVKSLCASVSAVLILSGSVLVAQGASADSVWVQSYERSSQAEVCSGQTGETVWQESWGSDSSWSSSWEQWANGGNGGWTCTRNIMWARTPVLEPEASSSAPVIATFTCLSSGVRSPGGGTCEVGDSGPGGGKIFYIDTARTAGSQFWEVGSDLGSYIWGCESTDIGGTGTNIGTGDANTTAIKNGCLTDGIAARVASATAGGYSDWFLPSQDELNQMCKYARMQSTAVADRTVPCDTTGTLRSEFVSSAFYWSSSQFDMTDARFQNFVSVGQGFEPKNSPMPVRAVRAF